MTLGVQQPKLTPRIAPWLLALCVIRLIGSGWRIRNASPIFAVRFPAADVVKNLRYNAWYRADQAARLHADSDRLALAGLIETRPPRTVDRLHALPRVTQVTRHICVEGHGMIGAWSATPLKDFVARIGAATLGKYVGSERAGGYCEPAGGHCEPAGGYCENIGRATALHPRTLMAFGLSGDTLPTQYGDPFKIRIPTKLGFKNPNFVTTLYVTKQPPRGVWTDRGTNWFSGI